MRSARQVLEDHLRLRHQRRLDDDLRRNYAADVVLLTENSVMHGHDGIRFSAARLEEQLPDADFEVIALQVWEDCALLIWRSRSRRYCVECGADTFVVGGGKIRLKTVHYSLLPAGRT